MDSSEERAALKGRATTQKEVQVLRETYEAISSGAEAFLRAEYSICFVFVVVFAVIIFVLISWGQNTNLGFLTALSFVLGAVTSIACGYIGMRVAVYSNVRTTINAQRHGWMESFNTAFRAGSVMGFALTGLGILVMYVMLLCYATAFEQDSWILMMGAVSGYGLGGSSIALFGRVGGGERLTMPIIGASHTTCEAHGAPAATAVEDTLMLGASYCM